MNKKTNEVTGLESIEAPAKNYRQARDLLADRVRQLNDKIAEAKRAAEPLIRTALQAAKAAEVELSNAIQANPQLFKKPRSQVFHGVKCGIEKGKGTLVIEDTQRTVQLIGKHLVDQFDILVKTKQTPIKTAIAQLPAADLKRIGVELKDAGDQVVIRPVDGEIEKMLEALLQAEGPAQIEDEA